jgi:hypothetical protein
MKDEYTDPYDTTYYHTPVKANPQGTANNNTNNNFGVKNNQARVFNPYEVQTKVEENNEDFPDKIDLTKNVYAKNTDDEYVTDEDPPLLDELGIVPENIKQKFISVLTFHKIDKHILEDSDMAGPFLIFILFGFSLALVN